MKNKKKIILITTISIILVGVVGIILGKNLNLLSKLKSSIIDPITGDVCSEDTNSSNISHSNGETVKKILDDLYAESNSTCSTGYRCDKPPLPTQVEPESCFTLSTEHIMYNKGNNTITVDNALKELYTIYNSAGFCPQKYCNPITYTVTLDKNGGTTQGTSAVYEKYDTGFYSDEEAEDYLSNIEVPTIAYTVTYDDNGTGATFSDSTAVVNGPFDGYYRDTDYDEYFSNYYECDSHFYNYNHDEYEENYNYNDLSTYDPLIESDGRINMSSNSFPHYHECKGDKLLANYSYGVLESQPVTKADHTCYWKKVYTDETYTEEDSSMATMDCDSGGYCYISESDIPIKGNTTLYAECYKNPELTVINYICDENGDNCNEHSRNSYIKEYGVQETIYPDSISGYSTPDGATVTYNGDHTLKFYYTKNNTYANFGQGTNNSNYVISQNSANTAMTISPASGVTNANYVAIYSAAASGQDYKWHIGAGQSNGFEFSHFTATGDQSSNGVGYGAPSNGANGVYIASFLARDNDNQSWQEVSGGNAGSAVIRPTIRVIHMNDTISYGATQTKTLNSTISTYAAPIKTGYRFKAWQAMGKTTNSTGVTNAPLTACTQGNSNVYYPAAYTINTSSWNLSNQSYPCPSMWGYVDNVMTVYLYAVWQKNPWYDFE